jgi:hypothetical protein
LSSQALADLLRIKRPRPLVVQLGQLLAIILWVSRRLKTGLELDVNFDDLECYFGDWDSVLEFVTKFQFTDSLVLQRQLPFEPTICQAYVEPMRSRLESIERAKLNNPSLEAIASFLRSVIDFHRSPSDSSANIIRPYSRAKTFTRAESPTLKHNFRPSPMPMQSDSDETKDFVDKIICKNGTVIELPQREALI